MSFLLACLHRMAKGVVFFAKLVTLFTVNYLAFFLRTMHRGKIHFAVASDLSAAWLHTVSDEPVTGRGAINLGQRSLVQKNGKFPASFWGRDKMIHCVLHVFCVNEMTSSRDISTNCGASSVKSCSRDFLSEELLCLSFSWFIATLLRINGIKMQLASSQWPLQYLFFLGERA